LAECLPPRFASDEKQSSLLSSHLAPLRIKHKAVYVLSTQPTLQYIRFFKTHIVALLISRERLAECLPPRSASDEKQSSLLSSHLASLRIKHKVVYVLSTQPTLQYIRFFKTHIVALLISRERLAECLPPRFASDEKQSSLLSSHLAPLRIKHKAVYVLSTQPTLQY